MDHEYKAIKVNGLTKCFNELTAVDDLSFEVHPGEIFGLVGPDGAGKSTTLRMVTAILKPSDGTVHVAGCNVTEDPLGAKDQLAYMSQRFGLYADLTVSENIKFYSRLYNVPKREGKERIEELLDFSYMKPFKNRRAGNLSGGMKQKLQLICALIHTPKVLLLDEPTNGVDPVSRRDFWRILYQLLNQDVAIVVTTAYMDEAERCGRVGMLDHGRLLATGTPSELRGLVAGKIVAVRSSEARKINRVLAKEIKCESINVFGDNVHVLTSDPYDTEREITDLLGSKKITCNEIRTQDPSLEDVFVSILGNKHYKKENKVEGRGIGKPAIESLPNKNDGPAVTVSQLTKRFGDFVAVNRVNFDVAKGEIFGFLGPNGAGKSTVIKMLCGLLPPSEGSGTVHGFDVNTQTEQIKSHIGYMSQKFSLYEDLTVEENINFYGGIYGLKGAHLEKRKAWAVETAGLKGHEKEMTSILSGGWKQRLAMACACLHQPPVIFLDEPTSGVDPLSRRRFWDLIYEMAETGTTIFVTTHYMEEAEYCDRIALIFRGDMIALGTPADLKTQRMRHKILDIKCPNPERGLERLTSLSSVRDAALFGAGIHAVAQDDEKALNQIKDELKRLGAEPYEVEICSPTMEDLFVSLIEEASK